MIDSEFIEKWEPKYDEIESDQNEYLRLVKQVSDEINDNQNIKLETFKKIIDWKSSRAKGYVKWDNYNIYQRIFKQIINPESSQKMRTLDALPGIGPPVASTILHFIYPDVFPIYDFRTVEVLKYFNYLTSITVSLAQYPNFTEIILKIRKNLVNYDLRQIDRALFAFHKSNPAIFKNKCKTEKNKRYLIKEVQRADNIKAYLNKGSKSIPEIINSICEELGENGREISREEIIEKARGYGLNRKSILPADYCDNTKTGRWSKHSFLHSINSGRYILARYKNK